MSVPVPARPHSLVHPERCVERPSHHVGTIAVHNVPTTGANVGFSAAAPRAVTRATDRATPRAAAQTLHVIFDAAARRDPRHRSQAVHVEGPV